VLLYKPLNFVCIIYNFPLEHTSVIFTCREEELTIVTEEARGYSEQMITIALIISLSSSIRVVKKTNGTQLISHSNDGSTVYLANLGDFISL
jgi:hypothetical protein